MRPHITAALLTLAVLVAPNSALAQGWGNWGGKTIDARDIRTDNTRAHLDLNLNPADVNAVTAAGLVLRRLSTSDRDAITCDADANEGQLIWNASTNAVNVCEGAASWAAFTSGGGGESLNATYIIGNTITLTDGDGPLLIEDQLVNTNDGAVVVSKTGLYTGAQDNAGFTYTNAVAATTAADVLGLQVDFTGATNGGAGVLRGLEITMAANTETAINIPTGGLVVSDGGFTLSSGAFTYTTGDLTIADGSLSITDADDANSFALVNNTITGGADLATISATLQDTADVLTIDAVGLTSGDLLELTTTDAGFTTGCFIRANDGADQFTVCDDGLTTWLGTASGTDVVVLDNGDILVTSGNIDIGTGNFTVGTGNLVVSDGNLTLTESDAAVAELTITCAGAMGSVGCLDLNSSHTGANDAMQITTSGNFGGNAFAVESTAIHTGDLVGITLDALAVGAGVNALSVTNEAGAHTGPLVLFTDLGTDSGGDALAVTTGAGVHAGSLIDLTYGGAGTGSALNIDMNNANAGASPIFIDDSGNDTWSGSRLLMLTGTGVFTGQLLDLNVEGAGTGSVIDVDISAVHTGNVLDVLYTAAATGNIINASMSNAAAGAGFIDLTDGGRATTKDLLDITQDGTSSGDGIDINKTGAASTGSNINLTNTVVVAAAANKGRALTVDYNAAAAGAVGHVAEFRSSTATWAASGGNARDVVFIDMTHAGGTLADDAALRINATTTNGFALHVDAGNSTFDEGIGIGTAGVANQPLTIFMAAPDSIVIDAEATDTTETNGLIDMGLDSGTANVLGISVDHEVNAVVGGNVAISGEIDSSTPITGTTNVLSAFEGGVSGSNNATEVATFAVFTAKSDGNSFADETVVYGLQCGSQDNGGQEFGNGTGGNDACIASVDQQLVLREENTTGAAQGILIVTAPGVGGADGGDYVVDTGGSDGAGGDAGDIIHTPGPGGTNADNDGDWVCRLDDQATGGAGDPARFVIENDDGSTQFFVLDLGKTLVDPTAKSTQAGITVDGSARGFGTHDFSINTASVTGGAAATVANSATTRAYQFIALPDAGLDLTWTWVLPDDFDAAADLEITLSYILDGAPGAEVLEIDVGADSVATNGAFEGVAMPSAATACDVTVTGFSDNDYVRARCTLSVAGTASGEVLTFRAVRNAADSYGGVGNLFHVSVTYRTDRL